MDTKYPRQVMSTAEINAGIRKFNAQQQAAAAPAKPAPASSLRRPRPRGSAAAMAVPAAGGNLGMLKSAMDASDVAMGGIALPFAGGLDFARRGLARVAGVDLNTLDGGAYKYADAASGMLNGGLQRLKTDAQAQIRSVLGVEPAAAPAAAAPAAKPTVPAAAAPAPAAPAPAAATPAAPAAAPAAPQGDDRQGNYWIGSDGVRRNLTWDAKGNITGGLRDGNDPAVKRDRQANQAAITSAAQPLYTGLRRM